MFRSSDMSYLKPSKFDNISCILEQDRDYASTAYLSPVNSPKMYPIYLCFRLCKIQIYPLRVIYVLDDAKTHYYFGLIFNMASCTFGTGYWRKHTGFVS